MAVLTVVLTVYVMVVHSATDLERSLVRRKGGKQANCLD